MCNAYTWTTLYIIYKIYEKHTFIVHVYIVCMLYIISNDDIFLYTVFDSFNVLLAAIKIV